MNWQQVARALLASLMVGLLTLGLLSCGKSAVVLEDGQRTATNYPTSRVAEISEVSPPEVIQELRQILERNQPQVEIVSPQPNEVLQDNTVLVKLRVEDLPLFKDAKLDLGPHLQVFLDNQPAQAVYDLSQPVTLQDLTPGTHTLQVIAAYPWYESFKNEGAYAQTTFQVFTKTQNNNPNPTLPLLTHNRPQGTYGAEPIMLDFYLTNAPLHLVAQERSDDNIVDWQIRCTINGASFILDRWQPIYLKGFKPGKNWVQLEFLDEKGNLVQNVFNDTIRLITYEPSSDQDTLSKLVQGELKEADARGIVDPNYTAKTLVPTPSLSPAPTPEASPTPTPIPEPSPPTPLIPSPQSSPNGGSSDSEAATKRTSLPTVGETPPSNLSEDEQTAPETAKPTAPAAQKQATELTETAPAEVKQPEETRLKKFFNRFRRSSSSSDPSPMPPTLPEIIVTPSPELAPPKEIPQPERAQEPQPLVTPHEQPSSEDELPMLDETGPTEPGQLDKLEPDESDRIHEPSGSTAPPVPPTLSQEEPPS